MASEIELKPCPCCGGHATMEHGAERSENGWVVCMGCGLSTRYHDDMAEAAEEWNRRACDAHHETPSTVHNGDCVPKTERNSAAMREALEYMLKFDATDDAAMDDGLTDAERIMEYADHIAECQKKARAALSAHPRNCDRFADETDAQVAFLNEVWLISVTKETALECDRFENWTDEMRSRYAKWLLAPAAERKGETNGR